MGPTMPGPFTQATPPPQGPTPAGNRHKLQVWLALVAGLVVGFGIGLVAARSGSSTATVAASNASTTQQVPASSTQPPTTPSTKPPTTTEPPTTTTTAAPYTPVPTDFKIEVVELERSCFGSAGCNVRFSINPTYVGAQMPSPTGTYTVLYAIQGADSPKTGSFTLTGGQIRYDKQDSASTPGNGPLLAVVTRVLDQ